MRDPPARPTPADTAAAGAAPDERRPIHPEVDWQAALLAAKVLRRVMTLAEASAELAGWQSDALGSPSGDAWRAVEPRALIVTHMMNRLLNRGW